MHIVEARDSSSTLFISILGFYTTAKSVKAFLIVFIESVSAFDSHIFENDFLRFMVTMYKRMNDNIRIAKFYCRQKTIAKSSFLSVHLCDD